MDFNDENIQEDERRLLQKELIQLEDEKIVAEQRYRSLFESALVGLFRGDLEKGVLLEANQETARIFGYDSAKELIEFFNSNRGYNFLVRVRSLFREALSNETRTFSSKLRRADGSEIWVQFWIRFIGQSLNVEGAVREITDQVEAIEKFRQAKLEAEEANKAKSRFLATMSHEIRTPLNGIIGYTEIIASGDSGDPKAYARKILDESDRLMLLLNQLLDLSRLEAEKTELETILFDLNEVLDDAESVVMKDILEKGLDYRRDRGRSVPQWFIGDPLRLGQILMNLLTNAVKFTDKGKIVLRLRRKRSSERTLRIEFSVIDTGIGIPLDKQDAIFASFEQADSSISRRYGGSGLGVPICRELVDLMDGTLLLDSIPGEGSDFHFTIPMTPAPESVKDVPVKKYANPVNEKLLKGVSVLIVEDYETNREIVRHHLEKAGCLVDYVNDGKEAVDFLLHNDSIRLVFMDMHLPVMDGLTATRELRSRGFTGPIIGLTASAYANDRIKCLGAGMDDFLTKPIRRAALLSKAVDWIISQNIESGTLRIEDKTERFLLTEYDSVTPASVIRYNDLLEELNGAEDLAFELMNGFVENTAAGLKKAAADLHAGMFSEVHREVHSIKGGALNLMADDLAIQAINLERALRDTVDIDVYDDIEGFEDLLEKLKKAFNGFEEWLRKRENNETAERQPGPL